MEDEEGYIVVIACKKCGRCDYVCPQKALYKLDGFTKVDYSMCNRCMECVKICPNKALVYME
ncbi:4Fe-4S binding protein [Methanolobus sp. ZRKC3]|uniref:4Fe-4S binding protein n=1 Tax=Methanolobus sp. ZRKC3 TaxID=3125786 RepID=UPI00324FCC0D